MKIVTCQVTIKLSRAKYMFDAKLKGNVDCCIYLQDATEAAVCRFFFLSGFSFTNIHDSQNSRGRGGYFFYSSVPLPPASQTC